MDGTSSGAGCGMKINRVNHRIILMALKVDLDRVTFANAEERGGDLSVKCPVWKYFILICESFQFFGF